ncbi:chemotaxis protein CheA [Entomospira culicis]|uniref:Chemotaxis protein CheA n=1 Tax=Entomospira culicis TaxID=2719989 RepID=A0A968GDZ7_9SPIO|nr:chemotaxis protein CheA [Entomospira culicis]NIZ18631.1 chemotaxis protein CheA [Entomospira culicis]NIZ68846.1 chemotaxis protein CheA [Entomospira culicis]WDI37440.1 chemotaxis protein CheA [Entomospira culicis]WDI39068.1 chemotaxis protein CheA [Entomospira culicis]
MSDYFDTDNDDLLKVFYIEAEQQVEKLEQNVLAMEDDPSDKDAIDEIFRAAHTVKGGAATVQMTELAEFTHAVEDLLDEIRADKIVANSEIVDAILRSVDVIKAMLEERKAGSIYQEDVSELKESLRRLAQKDAPKTKPKASPTPVASSAPSSQEAVAQSGPSASVTEHDFVELREMLRTTTNGEKVYRVRVEFDEENPMNSVGGIQIFALLKKFGQILRTFPDFDSLYEDQFFPFVDYYILSSMNEEEIAKKSMMSDVTLSIDVHNIDNLPFSGTPESVPQEVAHEEEPSSSNVPATTAPNNNAPAKRTAPKKSVEQAQIIRVDSKRIDVLLNLVSEIVITKGTFNQISGQFNSTLNNFYAYRNYLNAMSKSFLEIFSEQLDHVQNGTLSLSDLKKFVTSPNNMNELQGQFDSVESEFKSTMTKFRSITTDLARTTGELHNAVLKIRMVPVDQVFQRFPRLVRDLAKNLHKNVRLEIIGGETEMDKIVTEELFDPLMHCVRNSMDHGLETPEKRLASGKSEQGSLSLKASNQGNMVVIEITDDGAGIDVEAVKAKAIERGILSAGKVISDQEAFHLIMEPGFSTAKQITDISGRGVGLDVVRKSIEKLNGEITIWSEYGKGSTFTIKLPLTLAIIQGLMVRVADSIYVIPITSVLESFRIKPEVIMHLDGYEVFNVREDVVSILRLSKLFQLPSEEKSADYNFIVVVGTEEKKIGLMVDALIGEEDVVIKPLRDQYTSTPGVAGATILGDGSVSLIVDVGQLLALGLNQEIKEREVSNNPDIVLEENEKW